MLNLVQGDDATGRALVDADIDGVAFTGSAEAGHAIARRAARDAPAAAADRRDGRQEPGDRHGARRPRDRRRGHRPLGLRAVGPEVQLVLARGRRARACTTSWWSGSRPARASWCSATRPTRRPRSARSSGAGAIERFDAAAAEARRDGTVVAGGERDGGFVSPTLVTGLPRGHRLTREELFLPFLTVTPVDSLDDALEEANAVEYGLTAGIFSDDEAEVEAFLDRIEAGVVYVNRRAGATTGAWPGIQTFCGWKASGASGKGGLGPHYVMQFMREQSRTVVRLGANCGIEGAGSADRSLRRSQADERDRSAAGSLPSAVDVPVPQQQARGAVLPSPASNSGGSSLSHGSNRCGQRGCRRQPGRDVRGVGRLAAQQLARRARGPVTARRRPAPACTGGAGARSPASRCPARRSGRGT